MDKKNMKMYQVFISEEKCMEIEAEYMYVIEGVAYLSKDVGVQQVIVAAYTLANIMGVQEKSQVLEKSNAK